MIKRLNVESRRAQDEMVEEPSSPTKSQYFVSKAAIGRFGNPYFKDQDGLGPPENRDTIEKRTLTKVSGFEKRTKLWTAKEKALLKEGVANNNLEKRLEPLLQQLRKVDKAARALHKKPDKAARSKISKQISEVKLIPKAELLADSSDIDFFKISKNYVSTFKHFLVLSFIAYSSFRYIHPTKN